MNCQELLDFSGNLLLDKLGKRYDTAEKITWINAGSKEIASLTYCLSTHSITDFIAAEKKIRLPDDYLMLIGVYFNGVRISPLTIRQNDMGDNYNSGNAYILYEENVIEIVTAQAADILNGLKIHYKSLPASFVYVNGKTDYSADISQLENNWFEKIIDYILYRATTKDSELSIATSMHNNWIREVIGRGNTLRTRNRDQVYRFFPREKAEWSNYRRNQHRNV